MKIIKGILVDNIEYSEYEKRMNGYKHRYDEGYDEWLEDLCIDDRDEYDRDMRIKRWVDESYKL